MNIDKKELTSFKNRYLSFFKKNNQNSDICEWLENAVDFEKPDGYYYDKNNKVLIIFEHFDIDCSEKIKKKDKVFGSVMRKNSIDKIQEVSREIETADTDYQSTKIIEQGYYKQEGNKKIFHIGHNGAEYRNNFVQNFLDAFNFHHNKIEQYIQGVINELNVQPIEVKKCFLIEDKTLLGTYYLNNKKGKGDPVILTDTLLFQETINNSKVDFVIFARHQDKTAFCGNKDDKHKKIDLNKQEFYVIPAIPFITISKKHEIVVK